MNKFVYEIIIHIIFWVSTTWLITNSFSISAQEVEIINGEELVTIVRDNGIIYQLSICIGISFLAFYIHSWLIITTFSSNKSIIYSLLITLASTLLAIHILTDYKYFTVSPTLPKELAFGVAIFYISISTAYGLIKKSINDVVYLQQLVVEKKQAQLNLLRNQLQPHFLFNALNNLLSMVHSTQNPKLAHSIDKLSQLLRYVVEESKGEKVRIADEIEFLKNYIDLQMLRFEEGEVNVRFNIEGPYNTQEIEPGLFIPFLENAFKYGTEPEKSTTIEIDFDLSADHLIKFKIQNQSLLHHHRGAGTGIENARKRLSFIYPDQYQLTISDTSDFVVKLTIQTK